MFLICAAIMMKDEENTIIKTLSSIINNVDHVVILDTGSQDKSVSLAKSYCESKGVPLKLETMKWVDFSTNRNHLLKMCEGVAEYSILLDCNDEAKNMVLLMKVILVVVLSDRNWGDRYKASIHCTFA